MNGSRLTSAAASATAGHPRPAVVSAPPAAAADGAATSTRRLGLVIGVLSIAVFMSSLDLFIVNLAFPYIGREYAGTTLSSLSWVLNAYTIVFAAVLVPAGRWADRIGRRRVFVAGLVAFSAGSLLCGLTPSVPALVGARIIQAAGAGMMAPASLSLLLACVPARGRTAAIGTWSAFGAMGAAFGPVLGGALVQLSWRWVFLINIPIGLVALALVKAPAWGWGSAAFIGTLAAAVACGAAMVVRSHAHQSPVIELGLLRSRTFSGAFVASILFYAAFGAFILNFVEFLTGVWHYSAVQAGLAIAPGPLMVQPFARIVAPLATRIGGPGRAAVIGCAVLAAAQLLWYVRIAPDPAYAARLLPSQLLGGAGVGLAIPALLGTGSASLPPDRFGTGSGILNMARQIGIVLGVAGLVGILANEVPGDPLSTFRHGLVLIISLLAAAGLVAAGLLTGRPSVALPAAGTES